MADIYRIETDHEGWPGGAKAEARIMVRLGALGAGTLAPAIDGKTYRVGDSGIAAWGFHSWQPSVAVAEEIVASLLYDMEHPS